MRLVLIALPDDAPRFDLAALRALVVGLGRADAVVYEEVPPDQMAPAFAVAGATFVHKVSEPRPSALGPHMVFTHNWAQRRPVSASLAPATEADWLAIENGQ